MQTQVCVYCNMNSNKLEKQDNKGLVSDFLQSLQGWNEVFQSIWMKYLNCISYLINPNHSHCPLPPPHPHPQSTLLPFLFCVYYIKAKGEGKNIWLLL